MQIQRFSDSQKLNEYFVRQLAAILQQAIEEKGRAYFVVSGGKTPLGLFQALSEREEVDWEKVIITLADERWIAPSEKDSNENLVKNHLLRRHAQHAQLMSLYIAGTSIDENIKRVNERLAALPSFDVVILGMGEDGHTASLFPCSEEVNTALAEQKKAAVLIKPKTAPYARISLTPARLLNSRYIFLHLVGESKLAVLNQAMAGDDILQMPVRVFLQQSGVDVQVMFAPW